MDNPFRKDKDEIVQENEKELIESVVQQPLQEHGTHNNTHSYTYKNLELHTRAETDVFEKMKSDSHFFFAVKEASTSRTASLLPLDSSRQ